MDNKINKEDRRVRKTEKLLKNGLAELISKKPIKSITVRELSELVDINRGTFYLHYKDIYDMVDCIENELFDDFNEIISSHENSKTKISLVSMLKDLFEHLAMNAQITKSLIGKNGDPLFVDRLKGIVREKAMIELYALSDSEKSKEIHYFYHFVISGCIGIFEHWLDSGMTETPEQMSEIVANIIFKGMNAIK